MSKISLVKKRIRAGHRVRFLQDYFGAESIELSWHWLPWPKTRFKLSSDEMQEVKALLTRQRSSQTA